MYKSLPLLDPMPTHLLFEHLETMIPTITNIFNQSLASGIFPSEFKTAVVKPLLKKSGLDPDNLKNYRPVSNLPFLSKVLEKLVLRQLTSHLSTHSLLSEHQSAYRPRHSTETVLLSIFNDILTALDENNTAVLLLLDLSAAFDTIDHELLLRRLKNEFGITDIALSWFRSYLSERKQFVVVENFQSPTVPLDFGVPQGSVLGPILFIMYTTPLTRLIESHSVRHEIFADDTQLPHSSYPGSFHYLVESLSDCVRDVSVWMDENMLKLNPDKTEAVLFSHELPSNADLISDLPSSISLSDAEIPFDETSLSLGFLFDSELNMKAQVASIRKKAYLQIRRISSIRPFLSEDATKKLVTACILSRLDYCNALLVDYPKSIIDSLQLVQNDAARLVFRQRRSQHVTPLLRQLHWLPIEQRLKYKICCIFYNIYDGTAPSYLSNRLNRYVPARALRSVTEKKFDKAPRFTREIHGGRTLAVLADRHWNTLPRNLRASPSLESFKSNLKTYLFREAFG